MVVWGIGVKGDPVNLDHVHTEIVPIHKNHDDAEVTLILEDHADAGTVLVLENRVDKVNLIPKNHVNDGTVHVHTSMPTEVQIPQRSDVPTTQLWTP